MSKHKDRKVGYKKPPKSTQFKPGQSGNPKGRPKKVKNIQELVKTIMEEEVPIKLRGEQVQVTMLEAYYRSLAHGAVALKTNAMKELSPHLKQLDKRKNLEQPKVSPKQLEQERLAAQEVGRIIEKLKRLKLDGKLD